VGPSPDANPSGKKSEGRHSPLSLTRQRVFRIARGYEDQNDSSFLREGPLLKHSCESRPESDPDLASQPTISRMEDAATARAAE
jgi:hypothetical protein